jgi:hypothetical protein
MAVIPVYLLLLVVAGLGMGQVGHFFFPLEYRTVLAVSGTTVPFLFASALLFLVISCMFYFCL